MEVELRPDQLVHIGRPCGEVERKARSSGESDLEQGPARHYAGILKCQKFHKRLIPFTINKKIYRKPRYKGV